MHKKFRKIINIEAGHPEDVAARNHRDHSDKANITILLFFSFLSAQAQVTNTTQTTSSTQSKNTPISLGNIPKAQWFLFSEETTTILSGHRWQGAVWPYLFRCFWSSCTARTMDNASLWENVSSPQRRRNLGHLCLQGKCPKSHARGGIPSRKTPWCHGKKRDGQGLQKINWGVKIISYIYTLKINVLWNYSKNKAS